MRKNRHDWSFVMPNGTQSKLYKTYTGCLRAAYKLYPLNTSRKILKDGRWLLPRELEIKHSGKLPDIDWNKDDKGRFA